MRGLIAGPFSVEGTKHNAAVVIKQKRGFEKLQIFLIEIAGPSALQDCKQIANRLNGEYQLATEVSKQ